MQPQTAKLSVAVIGVGHLGKEHARILSAMPDVELVGVADVNADQAAAVASRCGTRACTNYLELLPRLDAAIIAVPTVHHHAVATECLRRGIALLVEKPLTHRLDQADDLLALARRQKIVFQVGHIERFNPAFEELQQRAWQPQFVCCERLGPFSGRSNDVGAVLDLMIHDIDLLLTLARSPILSLDAIGMAVLGEHEDTVHAHIVFANGCQASLTASRISPAPVRRMQVWAAEGFATVDFARRHLTLAQPSDQLRRHVTGVRRLAPMKVKEGLFDFLLPVEELDCDRGDQLTRELQHFLDCVRSGTRPRVGGEEGRDALAVAMQIVECVRAGQAAIRPGVRVAA